MSFCSFRKRKQIRHATPQKLGNYFPRFYVEKSNQKITNSFLSLFYRCDTLKEFSTAGVLQHAPLSKYAGTYAGSPHENSTSVYRISCDVFGLNHTSYFSTQNWRTFNHACHHMSPTIALCSESGFKFTIRVGSAQVVCGRSRYR